MPFFLLFYVCIFRHVVTSVLRMFLFAFLLACLIFAIIYVFPCLPNFLQWFKALLNYLLQANCPHLYCLHLCRYFWCHFLDFRYFLCTHFLFVASVVDLLLLLCCLIFCLSHFSFYWCFFGSFPACFFLLCKSAGYINLRVLVFVFLCDVVCFFALLLLLINHIAPQTRCSAMFPPLYPLWPPWPSLSTTWYFLARDHTWKYVLIAVFCLVSPCFLAPPWTHALLYPCEPLRTHPVPFAPILRLFCKTWCSGKFPRP